MEKVFFQNSRGEKLCGILSEVEPRETIAVLCHGHGSTKDSDSWLRLEPILNKAGISVFRFDFWGSGESDGDFAEADLTENIDCVVRAIEFVKGKGYERVILVGSSFGGLSSLMAASQSDDLAALVLKSPVTNYGESNLIRYGQEGMRQWEERGWVDYPKKDGRPDLKLNWSFVEDYRQYDPYRAAESVTIPTTVVHGNADELVLFSQTEELMKHLPSAKLEVVQGANHSYTTPEHFDQMIDLIADAIIAAK